MNTAVHVFYSYEHKHMIFGLLYSFILLFFLYACLSLFLAYFFSFLPSNFAWHLVLCIYKTNLSDNLCLNLSDTGQICCNNTKLMVRWDKFNNNFAEYFWKIYQASFENSEIVNFKIYHFGGIEFLKKCLNYSMGKFPSSKCRWWMMCVFVLRIYCTDNIYGGVCVIVKRIWFKVNIMDIRSDWYT